MFTEKTIIGEVSKHLSVAICALLFGSTMILSAVGPARADTPQANSAAISAHRTPATLRYMA